MRAVSQASHELRIAGCRAGWVRLPLRRPYVVAYEAIESFDLFITYVEFEDGTKAFGEACPLPGYTPFTGHWGFGGGSGANTETHSVSAITMSFPDGQGCVP